MKIALFSDIHANLPAHEAFFKDVDACQADLLYCLGDLVGYNIRPNEVIAKYMFVLSGISAFPQQLLFLSPQ